MIDPSDLVELEMRLLETIDSGESISCDSTLIAASLAAVQELLAVRTAEGP